MMRLLSFTLLLVHSLFIEPTYLPQASIEIQQVEASHQFGRQITISAHLNPISDVEQVYIFLQPQGQNTRLGQAELNANGNVYFHYDAVKDPIEPFVTITYWMRLILKNGEELESQHFQFEYDDNRFDWQTIQDEQFIVHWYQGDLEFGQTVMNVANQGMQAAVNILPETLENPVRIYVYANFADLQSALQTTQRSWIAGHASPSMSVIMISVPPGPSQTIELQRQIPHEFTHLVLHHKLGDKYTNIPVWLSEGLASMAELNPNPEYQRVLQSSAKNGALLPFSQLCQTFPREASGAYLAYAQSRSFTQYLYDTFGSSGLEKLLIYYQDGLGCEEAVQAAFGMELTRLDFLWQQEVLGLHAAFLKIKALLPYLILLCMLTVLPLLSVFNGQKKSNQGEQTNASF